MWEAPVSRGPRPIQNNGGGYYKQVREYGGERRVSTMSMRSRMTLSIIAIGIAAALSVGISGLVIAIQNRTAITALTTRVTTLEGEQNALADFSFNHTDLTLGKRYLLANETPTALGMKIIAAHLINGYSTTTLLATGANELIYLNPACNGDYVNCDVGGSLLNTVSSYFDMTANSVTLNTALKAVQATIEVGTFNYIRFELCKNASNVPNNIQYSGSNVNSTKAFMLPNCAMIIPLAAPLVVVANKHVEVVVQYSLTNLVGFYNQTTGDPSCTATTPVACLTLPPWVPLIAVS